MKYFFIASLVLCLTTRIHANFDEKDNSSGVKKTNNKEFTDYCNDISIAHSHLIISDNAIRSSGDNEIITANNICKSSNQNLNDAINLCLQESDEPACQYIASLALSNPNHVVSNAKSIQKNHQLTKLPLCEAAAENILGICNKKDPNLQNVTAQIAKQSAHQLANASALDICSNTARMAAAIESSLSATGFACASQVSSCNEACNEASEELRLSNLSDAKKAPYQARLKEAQKSCRAGQVAKEQLDKGVTETLNQIQVSAQCRNRLSADQELPTYAECKANATLKGCDFYTGLSQDCSQAQVAATNLTCICQTNPADTRCRSQMKAQSLDGGLSADPSRRAQVGTDESSGLDINPYGGQPEVALPTGSDRPTGFQLANSAGNPGGGGGSLGESLNKPYEKPQGEGSTKSKIDPNVIGRAGGILLPTELSKIFQPGYLKNQNRQLAMVEPPTTLKEKIKNSWEQFNLERFIPDRHSFKRFSNSLTKRSDPYALTYLNIVSPKICSATCVLNVVQTVVGPDAITGPDVDLFTKNSRAMIIHYHNPQELNPLLTPDVIEEIKEKGVVFKIPRPRKLTHAEMQERYHFPSESK